MTTLAHTLTAIRSLQRRTKDPEIKSQLGCHYTQWERLHDPETPYLRRLFIVNDMKVTRARLQARGVQLHGDK